MQPYNNTMEKTTTTCHGGGGGPFLLHLPEEVLIQILERLHVVSLLRFKCVCKSWRDLIQTSYFIHLHTTKTFNSSSSTSSNFGSFILRTDNLSSEGDVILMLSEYEGGSKSENGDWYRCTDGSWHKLTTTGGDDVGSRHKFSGDGGGDWADWQWDNTNYGGYRCSDGKFTGGGYWHWDTTNCGWYWVSDGRGHGGDCHWDNTNYGWYWVSDGDGGNWHWHDTNCCWYWVGDEDQDEEVVFKGDDDDDNNQLLLKVDSLELPSSYNLTCGKIIAGSCNGLICLYDQKLRDISLWNPATRQFRILPKSISIGINYDDLVKTVRNFVALGFDVKTKEYKVLLIALGVQVYSLSTDSWRLIINSPLGLPAQNHGLYMNGCCFFMATVFHPVSNTNNMFINSFDFTTEIFTTIQLPDHDDRQDLCLRCFGVEKMALFITLRKRPDGEYEDHYYYEDGYEDCDIWVLNEHGDGMSKESWIKLHSLQIKNSIRGQPIGISNNGKFAFLQTTEGSYGKMIQLYNLVTKEVKLNIPFCVSRSKVYVYKPSLVSVFGENGYSNINRVIGGAM